MPECAHLRPIRSPFAAQCSPYAISIIMQTPCGTGRCSLCACAYLSIARSERIISARAAYIFHGAALLHMFHYSYQPLAVCIVVMLGALGTFCFSIKTGALCLKSFGAEVFRVLTGFSGSAETIECFELIICIGKITNCPTVQ